MYNFLTGTIVYMPDTHATLTVKLYLIEIVKDFVKMFLILVISLNFPRYFLYSIKHLHKNHHKKDQFLTRKTHSID